MHNDSSEAKKTSLKAEVIQEDENAHFFKPVNLDDEQIAQIVKICFFDIFWERPREGNGRVVLFARKNPGTDYGVDFWIIAEIHGEVFNYRGAFVGIGDFHLYKGCTDNENTVPDDWGDDFGVPVKSLYEYLDTIRFFSRHEVQLPINGSFFNPGWQQIYAENYCSPAE
jgi:hypothetical protein